MQELRSSVRFPIKLPVAINNEALLHDAETTDISAGGVLFNLSAAISVGSTITFSISMPADVLGTPTSVSVRCIGRVVRCVEEQGRKSVAAVIDEYQFERAVSQ